MTQDNLLSFVRALLILVGSYVVGHNLFGHAVDSSTWQVISGAAVTVTMTIWGIVAKTTNIEGIESAVRSVITSIGGLAVSAAIISEQQLVAILAAIIPIATFLQSVLSKSKNSQIASGTIKTTVAGKALKMILILFLAGIGLEASAQSPFKPEHKVVPRYPMIETVQPDSFYNAWRFSANIAGYNYTFGNGGGSSAVSAIEYGYEHQKWNVTSGGWDVLWSINAAWIPINTSLPLTWANMQTVAATFGFKNPIPVGNSVIQIGPDFNPHAPKNQQFGIFATVGILLN